MSRNEYLRRRLAGEAQAQAPRGKVTAKRKIGPLEVKRLLAGRGKHRAPSISSLPPPPS